MAGARDAGAKCLYLERGPLPRTITVDPVGANDRNCLPRNAGFYLDWLARHPERRGDWRAMGSKVRQRASAHRRDTSAAPIEAGTRFIFVPLQKGTDTQLQIFGERCRSLEDTIDVLVEAARHLPEGWHIRLKEHPSERQSMADRLAAHADLPLVLDNKTDTFELVRASALVLTVNSSVGLEAMLFDKPVAAMGRAFWAFDGVAARAPDAAGLARLMADPGSVGFDPAARDAFLSFLVGEYYPELVAEGDGFTMSAPEREKISRMLLPGYPAEASA
jgi:capsular polysaccharide export protein